jgi:hypothetical protein
MGDVSDMLGLSGSGPGGGSGVASKASNDMAALLSEIKGKAPSTNLNKLKKPKGMSREVFGLMNADSLNSAMQSAPITMNSSFKNKRASALKGKWVWAPFSAVGTMHTSGHPSHSQSTVSLSSMVTEDETTNSSAGSGPSAPFLSHWVRAEVQYTEYPYSKFNIKLETVTYTDDEYDALLTSTTWTRSETDYVMGLAYKYDLRWPIVADRYALTPVRSCEEIQERFYSILNILKVYRSTAHTITATTASASSGVGASSSSGAGAGTTATPAVTATTPATTASVPTVAHGSNGSSGSVAKSGEPATIFNLEAERLRRNQLEIQFKKYGS